MTSETRGLVRYTVGLLRALSQIEDIEIVLFAKREIRAEHLLGVRARTVVFDAPRETLWYEWSLPRRIREAGLDVFHAPADRGLPAAKPCPLVVTVHESFERSCWRRLFRTPKERLWYWKHELVNYLRADAVITVSDTTRERLAHLRVAPACRLRRIYLAPFPEFHATAQPGDSAVPQKYGIREPFVLCVGGYDERKNVGALVDAFSLAALPAHQLVVVGVHRYGYEPLVTRWRGQQCFDRLKLIEAHAADLPALYRRAAFFVQPSVWESFSFPVVEAMACGTPALVSNRQALPEIAGGAVLHFDPEDVPGLAGLMEQIAADPALRGKLRTSGLARAREFSWKRVAAETVAVYREAIGRSHGRGA